MKKTSKLIIAGMIIMQAILPVNAQEEPSETASPMSEAAAEASVLPTEEPSFIPSVSPVLPAESEEPMIAYTQDEVLIDKEGIIDLNETAPHASSRLNPESQGKQRQGIQTFSELTYPLTSHGRVAQIPAVAGGNFEYISLFEVNGRPGYCAEPGVLVILNGANGPSYTADLWQNARPEDALTVKRLAWFGYGHPMTGTSYDAYVATQLLIWKVIAPAEYETINAGLQMCGGEPTYEFKTCTMGRGSVDTLMQSIENLADSYDTVPSFADAWHGTAKHQVEYDQTLTLNDTNNVLDWFLEEPQESHNGINLKVNGNNMLVDIDSLYYEGWDTAAGKTLTFKRRSDQWKNMMNGILIYSSGANQKLFGESSDDPTPEYKLSFKMKTSDIEVEKMDEYYQAGNNTAGTQFMIAWCEDPMRQYQKTGLNDANWTAVHDADQITKNDEDGKGNRINAESFYYPILSEDGSSVRTWQIGTDGILHIDGFLPNDRTWWLKEVNATNPYILDQRVFSAKTQAPYTVQKMQFVNALRDVSLNLFKKDEEDRFIKINDAEFELFEIEDEYRFDLSKDAVQLGTEINLDRFQNLPSLNYGQLKQNSAMQIGDIFRIDGYLYRIEQEDNLRYTVKAIKYAETGADGILFSRYQLPLSMRLKDTFEVQSLFKQHATDTAEDDEIGTYRMALSALPEKDGKTVSIIDTERKDTILVSKTTDPSIAEFQEAAKNQNTELLPGNIILFDHVLYTVKHAADSGILITPQEEYIVDLEKIQPVYADIPNPESLAENDTFELAYPLRKDDGTWNQAATVFTVLENSAFSIVLLAEGMTMEIIKPEWISYEDLPVYIPETEEFRVTDVTNPIYTVSDSRGNEYTVSDSRTAVESGDGKPEDIDYLTLIHSFKVREDGTSVLDPAGFNNGGACVQPYHTEGCQVGTVRVLPISETEEIDYEGVQYDQIDDAYLSLPVTGVFEIDGTEYTVKTAADTSSITVSFIRDLKEYQVELASGIQADKAVHIETKDVEFTVTHVKGKEIDLQWVNQRPTVNSLSNDTSIHLRPFDDAVGQSDIRYEDLENPDMPIGTIFTNHGISYKVIYQDVINHVLEAESSYGRFMISKEKTIDVTPIHYQEYLDKEYARVSEDYPAGKAFVQNDMVYGEWHQKTIAGIDFAIDGISYTVLSTAYANDRNTNTLMQSPSMVIRIIYSKEKDAPFAYKQIADLLQGSDSFEVNGVRYEWSLKKTMNDNKIYSLKQKDQEWIYYETELVNGENTNPYEQNNPVYTLRIDKPEEVLYEDFENARNEIKKVGDSFEADTHIYKIEKLDKDAVTVIDEEGKTITVAADDTESVFSYEEYLNAKRLILNKDIFTVRGTEYQLLQIENDPVCKQILTVKNMQTQRVFTIEEIIDNRYQTAEIMYFPVSEKINLSEIFKDAASIRIDGIHPSLEIAEEENIIYLKTSANDYATLLICDTDGNILRRQRIIISSTGTGTKKVLPLFKGKTGKQYLRITDTNDHNMPLPYTAAAIYKDLELTQKAADRISDENAVIDVSDFEAGKYYYQLNGMDIQSFTVSSKEQADGSIAIHGLKWGRSYMACESSLPDGFEFGSQEACHIFKMDAEAGSNEIHAELKNKRRILDLQVFKVDQDNHSDLLNNAWFSFRNITEENTVIDEKEQSSEISRISIEDIPNDAEVADMVYVWRADVDGKLRRWRIEAVDDTQIVIAAFDGNKAGQKYTVPKDGYSSTSMMLYQDILRTCSEVKVGTVFELHEKEDISALKKYRILALQKEDAKDLFDEQSNQEVIVSATVYDTDDTKHRPIELKAILSDEKFGAHNLGVFVTGGIFTEAEQQINLLPITYQEMILKLNTAEPKVGSVFSLSINQMISMPSVSQILTLLRKQRMDEILPGDAFEYAGIQWLIKETSGSSIKMESFGSTYEMFENTVPGDISRPIEKKMVIARLWQEKDGSISAVTYEDEQGNSWYLSKTNEQKTAAAGKSGVFVKVAKTNAFEEIVYSGYTNIYGELVMNDLADGSYYLSKEDEITEINVQKGMIEIKDIPYGAKIEVCEIKSPLGYIVGNACEVVTAEAERTTDIVRNYRTNQKLKKIKNTLIIRKMGEKAEKGDLCADCERKMQLYLQE